MFLDPVSAFEPITVDVVVLGAGPAGCLASTRLVQLGHRVLCLEKSFFPRHVIGESLLPRCNQLLREAGLLAAVEARGYTRKHGATFLWGNQRERFAFAEALGEDEPWTFQVPRDDFDQTLATEARRQGVDLRFGHAVRAVTLAPDHVLVAGDDLELGRAFEVRARFVLDCSGYGRVLPTLLGLEAPTGLPDRVACFTQVENDDRPTGDEGGDIWVCRHPEDGWIWIIPFSDGRTSVGGVCSAAYWDVQPGSMPEKLPRFLSQQPNTAKRLRRSAQVMAVRELRSYARVVSRMFGARWAVTGNAGDFLDPVFSSGVTLALESSNLAATLVHRFLGGELVDWERDYEVVMRDAVAVFRAFVKAWYDGRMSRIFFAPEKPPRIKRRITSILGGSVRRGDNPIVQDPDATLDQLYRMVVEHEAHLR
jgi:flavin-dependent dehydrogenase